MALADAYATAALYRTRVGATSTEDDTAILRDLTAISRYLDKVLHRRLGFNRDPAIGSAVARYYRINRAWPVLDIDDHVSISSIAIDSSASGTYSTTLTTDDYTLLPLNAATLPLPEPYRAIEATNWGTLGQWPSGVNIRVTGYGGWPAVPDAIVSATIELTSLFRIESPRATNRVNEMNVFVSTSKAAQSIVTGLIAQYALKRAVI